MELLGMNFSLVQLAFWGAIGLAGFFGLIGVVTSLFGKSGKKLAGSAKNLAGAATGSVATVAGSLDTLGGKIGDVTGGAIKSVGGLAEGAASKTGAAVGAISDSTGDLAGSAVKTVKTAAGGTTSKVGAAFDTDHDIAAVSSRSATTGWGFWPWTVISLFAMGVLGWLVWTSYGMSGMSAIKWIFWSILGLGGLFAVLGLSQMVRRNPLIDEREGSVRGLGFLTMISGLALAAASWFVWQPKIDSLGGYESQSVSLSAENTRLGGVVSDLKSKLGQHMKKGEEVSRLTALVRGLNVENGNLLDDNKDLRTKLNLRSADGDEVSRLTTLVKNLQGNVTTKGSEITRLNGLVTGLTNEKADLAAENTRMNGLIGKYKNDSETQDAKITSLEGQMETLRNKSPVIKTVTAPTTRSLVSGRNTPLTLIHDYDDGTNLQLRSDDYNIIKSTQQKMVQGKSGRFYYIDFIDPATGKGYKFESAKYSRVKNQNRFKKSLDRVVANIKGAFDGKRTYQLYVRGKASGGRYKGKMAKGFEYTDIKILPRVVESKPGLDGIWGAEPVDRQYSRTIRNDDLPNLRGAYLQDYIGNNYEVTRPIILDGKVSKSKKASKQAVSVILFVED